MADTKISGETAASALDGTELFEAVQGGNNRKATASQIGTYVSAGLGLGYFATGTDAANLSGTVGAARIAANSLAPSKLTDAAAAGLLGAAAAGARSDLTPAQARTLLGLWESVVKTADETRSATTTLAADTDLVAALQPGTYVFEFNVALVDANATMDSRFGLLWSGGDGGANATINWTLWYRVLHGGGAVSQSATTMAWTTPVSNATSTAGTCFMTVRGTITVVNAGTFQFAWAQDTSDAGNLTCKAGSYLRYLKIA